MKNVPIKMSSLIEETALKSYAITTKKKLQCKVCKNNEILNQS